MAYARARSTCRRDPRAHSYVEQMWSRHDALAAAIGQKAPGPTTSILRDRGKSSWRLARHDPDPADGDHSGLRPPRARLGHRPSVSRQRQRRTPHRRCLEPLARSGTHRQECPIATQSAAIGDHRRTVASLDGHPNPRYPLLLAIAFRTELVDRRRSLADLEIRPSSQPRSGRSLGLRGARRVPNPRETTPNQSHDVRLRAVQQRDLQVFRRAGARFATP
jgi:hypothetical protein